jgi:enamine deaminase RidA (YjgF/YER057c/UK114 family)
MADFPKFTAVRDRYLGGALAASTLLEVKGLARPGCCVEVEIIAAR